MPFIVPWGNALARWSITTAKWVYLERCKNPIFSDFLLWSVTSKGVCEKKKNQKQIQTQKAITIITEDLASVVQDRECIYFINSANWKLNAAVVDFC